MKKAITKNHKEQLENILLEAWREITNYKVDGRVFPNADKISYYADKIIEKFYK